MTTPEPAPSPAGGVESVADVAPGSWKPVTPEDGNVNRLLTYLTGSTREARLETALRRIVEAQALACWANTSAPHDVYERLSNDRDDAVDAAAEFLGAR